MVHKTKIEDEGPVVFRVQMVSQLVEIAGSIKGWTNTELFYFSQRGSHCELLQVRPPFLFCLLMYCERIPMINVKSFMVNCKCWSGTADLKWWKFLTGFAEKVKKHTNIDLRRILSNWFKIKLFPSKRLSRLRALAPGGGGARKDPILFFVYGRDHGLIIAKREPIEWGGRLHSPD